MSLIVNQISYIHTNGEALFSNVSFSLHRGRKMALVGNNGVGKSTLLRILAGELDAGSGEIVTGDKPYYIPQHTGQYNEMSVAEALRIDKKLRALEAITQGDAAEENFNNLEDDWEIEERATAALKAWQLSHIGLSHKMKTLSGGEKTKVFLAGIQIHEPSAILMDEPSNHLDVSSRSLLYEFIRTTKTALIVVSHDRTLLNMLNVIYELGRDGVVLYGGNYEFYREQKEEKLNSIHAEIREKEKEFRKAKLIAREAQERKEKQDARGGKKQKNEGVPKIVMGNMKRGAEASAAKLKDIHTGKLEGINRELENARRCLPDMRELKMNFENAKLHKGKLLFKAENINFRYSEAFLWDKPLSFEIRSGDRLEISGDNGKGKTTLLKLILGQLHQTSGTVGRADFKYIYLDQEYSIIDRNLTVFEQVEKFNSRHFEEHELKTLLHRFLFPVNTWDKKCTALSGGEKMKLVFCCLMVDNNTPDVFVLDEPTNNLDIQSLEIVTSVIRQYEGTVLVISHDRYFMDEIGVGRSVDL